MAKTAMYLLQETTHSGTICNLEEARRMDSQNDNPYVGLKFKTILQEADVVNQNKRLYSKRALIEGLNSIYPNIIRPGAFFGESSHPITDNPTRFSTVLIANSTHRVLETNWNGNLLEGTGETLNNTAGKDMKALILQGVPIGFSLRAMGKVTEDRSAGYSRIEEALRPFAYDFVHNPSHANALLQQIITESYVSDMISTLSESFNFLQESLSLEAGEQIELIKRDQGISYNFAENTALVCMGSSCLKVFLEEHLKSEFKSSFKKLIG